VKVHEKEARNLLAKQMTKPAAASKAVKAGAKA
jgi:hypothetical protein